MKKISSVLLSIVLMAVTALTCFETTATAMNFETGLDLSSEAVYMMNIDTGEVVVSINESEKRVPASLTKIMTCVVVLEQVGEDVEALKSKTASGGIPVFEELWGTNCSTADIQMNEEVTYYDLLHALMIPSACEAANILAVDVAGSLPAFIDLMNTKASEIGMSNSNFSNTHGLFVDENYTTCEDMAKLCQYALEKYPIFAEIVSKPSFEMAPTSNHPDGTTIVNTNKMLQVGSDYYYRYAMGIKTGFLDEAGRCLASYATNNGSTYIIVSMGASSKDSEGNNVMYNCTDHVNLYKWAFSRLSMQTILNGDSEITDIKVQFGDEKTTVNLKPAETIEVIWVDKLTINESDSAEVKAYKESIQKISDIEQRITLAENVVAPIKINDVLGSVELVYNGKVIANVELISTQEVGRSTVKAQTQVAKSFFKSPSFKIVVIVIIAVVALYFTIVFLVMK
ncbi:MAG: D-alanyl-D-alanine carboxypeptidase, partial [Clostridiales bacterium]|nr:D-alanyl-D-alanine carboxypeptidase [Clostridiales bacterium]